MRTISDKWTVFWLSIFVPGAGQLWAKQWTALFWFAAATAVIWATALAASALETDAGIALFRTVALLGLGLCSAECAKRSLELSAISAWATTKGNSMRVAARHKRGRAIDVCITVDTNRATDELWRRVSDLPNFLTIDPFHYRVKLMRGPQAGSDVVLWHNAFGLRFTRFGRILRWREGKDYAFSDLSSGDANSGFPHAFFVSVSPVSCAPGEPQRARLTIAIRGKWTSRWIPVWCGRWWVWLVCREHGRLLRRAM